MEKGAYRIQSSSPISGALWPRPGQQQLVVADRTLAVSLAAKSTTESGSVIEVVHVPSGEVVFRKPSGTAPENFLQ